MSKLAITPLFLLLLSIPQFIFSMDESDRSSSLSSSSENVGSDGDDAIRSPEVITAVHRLMTENRGRSLSSPTAVNSTALSRSDSPAMPPHVVATLPKDRLVAVSPALRRLQVGTDMRHRSPSPRVVTPKGSPRKDAVEKARKLLEESYDEQLDNREEFDVLAALNALEEQVQATRRQIVGALQKNQERRKGGKILLQGVDAKHQEAKAVKLNRKKSGSAIY